MLITAHCYANSSNINLSFLNDLGSCSHSCWLATTPCPGQLPREGGGEEGTGLVGRALQLHRTLLAAAGHGHPQHDLTSGLSTLIFAVIHLMLITVCCYANSPNVNLSSLHDLHSCSLSCWLATTPCPGQLQREGGRRDMASLAMPSSTTSPC